MGTFAGGIANYAKKTKLSIDDSVVAINSELFRLVAEKTPVLEGRLISNWQITFDNPSNEITNAIQSKQSKIQEAQLFAKNSAGKIMIMTNNLPYAYPIEYFKWSSVKAPNGMVRVSLLEIQSALRKFKTTK
jgi:hypothetical protein